MTLTQKFFHSVFGKKQETKYAFFNCLSLSLLLLTTVVYLVQVNAGISRCLEMEKIDKELRSLKIENEELLKQTTELGSMANVYQLAQGLKMVKENQADYLFSSGEVFAKR